VMVDVMPAVMVGVMADRIGWMNPGIGEAG
jgi:hypothetical protein